MGQGLPRRLDLPATPPHRDGRRPAGWGLLVVGVSLLAGAGCANRPGERDIFHGDPDPGRPYQTPDYVAGANRGKGRPDAPDPSIAKAEDDAALAKAKADAEAARLASAQKAADMWARAEVARDREDAGDLYRDIANDHRDAPRAEEARWRAAVAYFDASEWNKCLSALDTYTKDYPVNPHLTEAERLMYDAALRQYDDAHTGLTRIFKDDKAAFDALERIVDRFPQGQYPDDALMTLGEFYGRKREWAAAALQYKNLLLRYPDSEWSFKARLRLGDVYLARDQGAPYHAGYVDLDPREPTSPGAAAGRPVKSCVESALEQYEAFLERIAADPARRAEYADDVAYAQGKVAECRTRLGAKDRAVAGFYGGRGQGGAADAYGRMASNVESGRVWADGVGAATPRVANSPLVPVTAGSTPIVSTPTVTMPTVTMPTGTTPTVSTPTVPRVVPRAPATGPAAVVLPPPMPAAPPPVLLPPVVAPPTSVPATGAAATGSSPATPPSGALPPPRRITRDATPDAAAAPR